MTNPTSTPPSCTAFDGHALLARGALIDVALAVKGALTERPDAAVLVFDDTTGRVVDLDLRGSATEIAARLAAPAQIDPPEVAADAPRGRGRGRPKLGVVAREVTLLPRHWDWLALQPGGASQALRRLVDDARKTDGGRSQTRAAQEAAYRFMSAMAGNLPGFEEASRALFAIDRERFAEHASPWPADVRTYVEELAWGR
ncbi:MULTISPECIES: DUF2239 family protein [unclassified Beijerinckia]|uniref:DUF2239 family protein n=1 Tax=unclassified Beijerinckia TaxID=2638183 RepID=UPI0008987FE3|nr:MULTISPECIES: DUF2239 family protein [unclassified Beijerinckia]MDH7795122.1 hypothetical protein [Beijerinckia sp. GAS462]SEB88408.1 hypothetical protein SAMN05443249_1394 [Beijerinckia sp. 28-YEA-48]